MKAFIDKDMCIGCGLCESICPKIYRMDDEGKAEAIVEEISDSLDDSAREAESSCPVSAIKVE